jgi:hypothetical protein
VKVQSHCLSFPWRSGTIFPPPPTAKENCTFLTLVPLAQVDRHRCYSHAVLVLPCIEHTHPDSTPVHGTHIVKASGTSRPPPPLVCWEGGAPRTWAGLPLPLVN